MARTVSLKNKCGGCIYFNYDKHINEIGYLCSHPDRDRDRVRVGFRNYFDKHRKACFRYTERNDIPLEYESKQGGYRG